MSLDRLRHDLIDELYDRRIVRVLTQVHDVRAELFLLALDLLLGVRDDILEAVQASDQIRDVIRCGDRDPHFIAGHDRDVVNGEHVRRVGHRDQQRALVDERDRHRLVAACRRRADEVGRAHVDGQHAEIEVIQSVALGQRARQGVAGQRSTFQQHPLWCRSRAA